jgi:hypothetical protein
MKTCHSLAFSLLAMLAPGCGGNDSDGLSGSSKAGSAGAGGGLLGGLGGAGSGGAAGSAAGSGGTGATSGAGGSGGSAGTAGKGGSGGAGGTANPPDCQARCESAATKCGLPDSQATGLCTSLCSSLNATQLTCLESSTCASLNDGSALTTCGISSAGGASGSSGQGGTAGAGGDAGAGGTGNAGGVSGAGGAGGAGGDAGVGGTGATGGSGGAGGSGGSGAGQSGSSGQGGTGGSGVCDGTAATIVQINQSEFAPGTKVRLKGVVATSPKFLLSQSQTSCLWGVFVTTPGSEVIEYGSLQMISYGDPPVVGSNGKASCPFEPSKAGAIPNEIQPGDTLDVTGALNDFTPPSCAQPPNVAPEVGQRQLTELSCFQITSKGGTVVSPRLISGAAVLDTIAQGKNTNDLLRKYGGALVKIEGSFNSIQQPPESYLPGAAVSKFGDIRVSQTQLTVSNNIYYNDLSCAGPRDPSKRYEYSQPTTFTSFTGIVALDFCTWQLWVRERCGDIAPLSSVCDGPECTGGSGAGGSGGGTEDSFGLCTDFQDNDGDGYVDCEDKSCCGVVSCAPGTYCGNQGAGGSSGSSESTFAACTDFSDNDGDGFVDCDDKDCCSLVNCSAQPLTYCGKQGTGGSGGSSAEGTFAACTDFIDNDGDSFIDCEDKNCCQVVDCKAIAPASYCAKQL